MKTAMQELLEYLRFSNSGIIITVSDEQKENLGRMIEDFLELERKQIDNAFESGYIDCLADPEKYSSGKGYYYQNYNDSFKMSEKEIESKNIIQDLKDRYEEN